MNLDRNFPDLIVTARTGLHCCYRRWEKISRTDRCRRQWSRITKSLNESFFSHPMSLSSGDNARSLKMAKGASNAILLFSFFTALESSLKIFPTNRQRSV